MPWEDVAYTVEELDDPNITEFLTAVRSVYANGGVILRSFRATNAGDFDQAINHDFRGIDHAFRTFLSSPSVVAALPELQIRLPFERPPEFHGISPFGIEGELTQMLLVGGAYERYRGTVEQARSLSRRFMESIFGEDLHEVGNAGGSSTPWTPWFFDIVGDATFIVQDRRAKRIVLLCTTDTD